MFRLWIHYFLKFNRKDHLLIIAFDNESCRELEHQNINFITNDQKVQLDDIWVQRLNLIKNYLEKGYTVIHTDLDAYWLKNPLDLLSNLQVDLQISIGHGMPKMALNEWGFTLCCGFFILRSNPSTEKLMHLWTKLTNKFMNDQIALNEILLNQNIEWKNKSIYDNEGFSSSLNLYVKALDYNKVTRAKDGIDSLLKEEIIIYHPFLSGRFEGLKVLKAIQNLLHIKKEHFLRTERIKIILDLPYWNIVAPILIISTINKFLRKTSNFIRRWYK